MSVAFSLAFFPVSAAVELSSGQSKERRTYLTGMLPAAVMLKNVNR